MGVLTTTKNHLQLIYNSKNSLGKQALAYINSSEKSIYTLDTAKDNLTPTQWSEIASKLELSIAELVDKNQSDFKNEFGSDDIVMDDDQWIKVINKKPYLITKPILVAGDRVFQITTPSDILKYIEADSAGLEKPYNKK
jgi:arsenate reductase-like glutaredoxin family protein